MTENKHINFLSDTLFGTIFVFLSKQSETLTLCGDKRKVPGFGSKQIAHLCRLTLFLDPLLLELNTVRVFLFLQKASCWKWCLPSLRNLHISINSVPLYQPPDNLSKLGLTTLWLHDTLSIELIWRSTWSLSFDIKNRGVCSGFTVQQWSH